MHMSGSLPVSPNVRKKPVVSCSCDSWLPPCWCPAHEHFLFLFGTIKFESLDFKRDFFSILFYQCLDIFTNCCDSLFLNISWLYLVTKKDNTGGFPVNQKGMMLHCLKDWTLIMNILVAYLIWMITHCLTHKINKN